MFAKLLGRETGYCRGRGGSMHIADTSKGNLGAERAFENAGGTSGRDRLRMMNLIPELEAGEFGDYPAALAIHAEGSVEAEKSTVRRAYDPPPSRDYVRRIAGMDP